MVKIKNCSRAQIEYAMEFKGFLFYIMFKLKSHIHKHISDQYDQVHSDVDGLIFYPGNTTAYLNIYTLAGRGNLYKKKQFIFMRVYINSIDKRLLHLLY